MNINHLVLALTPVFFVGCSSISSQEKICQEEADIAETVMDARLKHGQIANASVSLAGNNEELREKLSPIIRDAFEYDRGGLATYEKTEQKFRDKYYQQCMQRQGS